MMAYSGPIYSMESNQDVEYKKYMARTTVGPSDQNFSLNGENSEAQASINNHLKFDDISSVSDKNIKSMDVLEKQMIKEILENRDFSQPPNDPTARIEQNKVIEK